MIRLLFVFLIIVNANAYIKVISKVDELYKYMITTNKIQSISILKKQFLKNPALVKGEQFGLNTHQRNILLIDIALEKGMIQQSKQLYYLNSFKSIKNGDNILIDAIEQNKNLDLELIKYKAKVVSKTTLKRAQTKVGGIINDNRSYLVKGKDGVNIGRFKPTDFYDTSKIIRLPSQMFSKNSNSTGYQRNAKKYWAEYRKLYSKDLSPSNMKLIRDGKSPIVDNTWLKAYPNHKAFKRETLQHHHLHHGGNVVPLPSSLHIGDNYKIFHTLQ